MNPPPLNLYVVDDDEPVRSALGNLFLSRGYGVRTFASGESFLAHADLDQGGVAVLDLRMEDSTGAGMSGLQVFEALRARNSPLVVVFLSGHGDIPTAVQAVKNGAFGWVTKSSANEVLLVEVQRACEAAHQTIARHHTHQAALALWKKLTAREMQVAPHYAEGLSSKEMARVLTAETPSNPIDHRTVEKHIASIRTKLDVDSSNALQKFMQGNGLPG